MTDPDTYIQATFLAGYTLPNPDPSSMGPFGYGDTAAHELGSRNQLAALLLIRMTYELVNTVIMNEPGAKTRQGFTWRGLHGLTFEQMCHPMCLDMRF